MSEQTNETTYYLEKAPVPSAIRHMVVPMMLSLTATLIYSLINAYFIGAIDNTPMLAAVTLATPFIAVFMSLGSLFGAGCGTYISRLLGEGKDVKTISAINFWFSLLVGVVFSVVALPFLDSIAKLVGAEGETIIYTKQYLFILTLGAPFFILNGSLEQSVRAEGAAEASMIGSVGGVILNIALDALLILGLGLEIRGAAIASVISTAASVVWFFCYLQKKSKKQKLSLRYFRPTARAMNEILKVGFSAFMRNLFMVVSSILFNNIAMNYGDYVLAGFGISQNLVHIVELLGLGFSLGVVPLMAYTYANNNKKRLNDIIKTTMRYMLTVILFLSALLFAFRSQAIALFSEDQQVIAISVKILTMLLISTLFSGGSAMITGMFQAFGNGAKATAMSVMRGVIFVLVLLGANTLFGLDGVVWSLFATDVLACCVGLALLLKKEKPPEPQKITITQFLNS